MLEAIIAGQRNPAALAQLARGSMRGKIRQLEEALDCSFLTEEHAAVLKMMLGTIDYYTTQIDELTAKIEALCEPYARQIAQLDAIPGTGVITAQDIIAEIGTDMTVFPTARSRPSATMAQSGGAVGQPRHCGGGGPPRPFGQKPYGRGAAHRSAGPHSQAGGSGRNAAR